MNGSVPVFWCPSPCFTAVILGRCPFDPFTFITQNLSLFSSTCEDAFCYVGTFLCLRVPLFCLHLNVHPACHLSFLASLHYQSCCRHLRLLCQGPRVRRGRRLPKQTQSGGAFRSDRLLPSCCHSPPCSLRVGSSVPCHLGSVCCCYSLLPPPLPRPPPLLHSSHLSHRRSTGPLPSIAGEMSEVFF